MKRNALMVLAAGIGVVMLACLVILGHRRLPSVTPTPSPIASVALLQAAAATPKPAFTSPSRNPAVPPRTVSPRQLTGPTTNDLVAFAQWLERFTNSSAGLVEGERLAWKRREVMLNLIQTDPARALWEAVPFSWREVLPAEITRFFEEQVDGRGDLKVVVATDFEHGHTAITRSVVLGTNQYQAFVYGRRTAQTCQTAIPLHGIALKGKMAVQADPLRVLTEAEAAALAKQRRQPLDEFCGVSGQSVDSRQQPVYAECGGAILCFCGTDHYDMVNARWALAENGIGGFGSTGVAGVGTAVNDAWTHGPKSVLYMRVNFPDDLTEPISQYNAYRVMDSVNSFYVDNSYGLTFLDTTVAPLVTLPQQKAWYATAGPGELLADAREATRLAGYDTGNYERDIVAFTPVPGYDFGGLAYVGGKGVWLQSMGAGVTAHELGHNYGLFHANFWDTTATASMMGPGTNLEYGNIFDTMGSAGAGVYHFNAAHKSKLDWLKADAVQVISTNGVYRIYPYDVPVPVPDYQRVAGRFYAAAVQKDFERYYWLEFRQLFTGNPWLQNGISLNWSPWLESKSGTQLIDTTPGSPTGSGDSRDDSALVIGRTFNDNPAGVHITTLARGATGANPWLDVQVNVGLFPGNQPPQLAVEVEKTNVAPGSLVHFHATAVDPDGDTLSYAWSFDDLTFSTNNLPWIAKSFATAGDHLVRCVVSDMKGGEASANAVVRVGTPGGYRVSGRVTDTNGVPLKGVLVSNGATTAKDFLGGWTDSKGRYMVVNATANLTLNAVQFGYTFASTTNWFNPLSLTNDTTDIDFVGVPLPTVYLAADTNAVAKNDPTNHYFTLTRTGDTNGDLMVQLYLSGSAALGKDFTLIPWTGTNLIIIPAGTNSLTFVFHTINNSLLSGPKTAALTLIDDINYVSPAYALAPPATAAITILGNDSGSTPIVTVTTPIPEIAENGIDNGQWVFNRTGSLSNTLAVKYSVAGTAVAGTNYVPLAGVAVIPAGENSATIPLTPLNDSTVTPDNTVVVSLESDPLYSVGSPSSATITLLESDFVSVTIVPTADAVKPSSNGRFTVKRDGDLSDNLVVFFTVGGSAVPGIDYVALTNAVVIPAYDTSADIIVGPIHNNQLEGDVLLTVTLTNDFNYDVATPGSATIRIRDDHLPSIAITAPVDTISEQGDTLGRFTISRGGTSGDLPIYLAVSGTAIAGGNYLPLPSMVVISNGLSSVSLDVIPFDDLILDPTKSVILTVLPNTNYNVTTPANAEVDIVDADQSQTPGVGFCFSTSAFPESQSPGIAVGLSITSAVPISVDYRVIGGTAPASRYSLPQGTLTISNGDWVGFIPLTIKDDTTVEPPQTVQVVLFNPINATLDYIRVHTYTILDDDANSASVAATVPVATESGTPGNFRISRAGPTTSNLLVNFQVTGTATAPTDYAPLGNSAVIPAGAAYVDLPVIPNPNRTVDLNQNVVLTLTSVPGGKVVSPNQATVNLIDNNTNPLPLVLVTSTNQPFAVEGGKDGAFVFTRIGPTNTSLPVNLTAVTTATPGRYVPLPNMITIPAGQTIVRLPVVAIDDNIIEGEQTITVSLTDNETFRAGYPSSATVTLQDNDQGVWIDPSRFQASKYGPIPGEFTFSRLGTTNTDLTIYFSIGGTAVNGFDYATIGTTVVIPAGKLSTTLPIVPLHTGVVEGPVTVTLTLLNNAAYQLSTPITATVTIDDDMPMLRVFTVVTNVLEGSGSNGVFRLVRTGDPQFDFTAHVGVAGTATYGVDYPSFPTNIYFTCGVTSIDLLVTPTNELVVEGDETVSVSLLPDPSYTILSPSNALLTINEAGTNQTPLVKITSPVGGIAYLVGTNMGLVLNATVTNIVDTNTLTLTWKELSGPGGYSFSSTNTADTTIFYTNAGIYLLRLTADTGQAQGFADVLAIVEADQLASTNLLRWTLDEGAGTNVLDVSGSGRDGQFVGTPLWTTNGLSGGALQFSGTNDYVVQTRNTNFLDGLSEFTLSLWVKPGSTNLDQGFFTANDSGTNQTLGFATRTYASCGANSNVLEITVPTTAGAIRRTSASSVLRPFEWQQVALV